jgi:hypothetical protein
MMPGAGLADRLIVPALFGRPLASELFWQWPRERDRHRAGSAVDVQEEFAQQ